MVRTLSPAVSLGGWAAFEEITQSYYEERGSVSASNAAAFAEEWARGTSTLDAGEFRDCFDENRYDDELTDDLARVEAAGVPGTPTFVIVGPDGERTTIVGPQPFESFRTVIERELDKVAEDAGSNATATNGSTAGEEDAG
jgi:predicted DsbA family dithiol-disulfide isomerase